MAATAALEDNISEELAPEDQARAAIYGLVSNLFYAAPGSELLGTLAQISAQDVSADAALARAWQALRNAAAAADEAALRQNYDDIFISTGRAPVFLYGSYYMAGFLMEKPLAALRDALSRFGLSRRTGSGESEDHISALCDVMRLLVSGDVAVRPAPIAVQREFFRHYIAPWYAQLVTAIENSAATDFYKAAARFAAAFFDLEAQSLEMA